MGFMFQTAYLASLVPLVVADIGAGGFLAIGTKAPWGIPDSSFRPFSQANATGSFSIPAFNLSSSTASLQGGDGRNWNIEISLQANIALNASTDKSLSAAEKEKFAQFVSMRITNVDETEVAKISSKNKMCGYVLSGLASNATADNQDDASKGGKCDFFSQQCREELQSAVQKSGSDCDSATLPDSCHDWLGPFRDETVQTVSFEFNEKLLTGSRFYAYGSAPTSENNETAYDAAVKIIWPVLFTWSHISGTPGNNITTTTSVLRCLRPSNITTGSRDPNALKKGDDGDKGGNGAGVISAPTFGVTLLLTAFASSFILI
ncbi:hypothetical protein V8C42DRAFT_350930 [Trichoderma barbatum]